MVAFHCVTWAGCTAYSRASCATVLSPTRASNPTLALKAALCRFRFAFIGLLFLIYSRPAKIETYLWSKNRGPPLTMAFDGMKRRAWPAAGKPFFHEMAPETFYRGTVAPVLPRQVHL